MNSSDPIFHVCPRPLWEEAQARGAYYGRPADHKDGYIHCSTAEQLRASTAKHAAGQSDLVLLSLDPARLGDSLRWEPARQGDLFPHIYGGVPLSAVLRADPLPLDSSGQHVYPAWLQETDEFR